MTRHDTISRFIALRARMLKQQTRGTTCLIGGEHKNGGTTCHASQTVANGAPPRRLP
jgi:hypothetical protein